MSDEEAESKVEVAGLLRRFLDHDASSGEALLEMSARCDPSLQQVEALLLEVLCLALTSSRTAELACGIVANLMLCEAYVDSAVRALDLPNALVDICCSNDDPYVLSEAVRALTNMVYKGKGHLLQPSFVRLSEFTIMVIENSLCSRLLAQVIQFVYYLQVYGSPATQEGWFLDHWNAAEFFRHLLGTVDKSADANMELSELLSGERLGDCGGLEWMFLCLDQAVSRSSESHLDWEHQYDIMRHIIKYSLTLLLSPASSGWDEPDVSVNATSGVSLSLQLSEKFLLLSILETVCGNYCVDPGKPTMVDIVDEIVRGVQAQVAPQHGGSQGLRSLLPMLLPLCEEAVLMKDSYALSAASFLVCALFAPPVEKGVYPVRRERAISAEDEDGGSPPPHSRVCKESAVHALIRPVVEIMSVPENTAWIKSVYSEGGATIVVRVLAFLLTPLKGPSMKMKNTVEAIEALLRALQ